MNNFCDEIIENPTGRPINEVDGEFAQQNNYIDQKNEVDLMPPI